MEQGDYPVDLVDRQGNIIGQKLRRQIDKGVDRFHAVHILMITPRGELVLSGIPKRQDLPNVYAHLLGTTVATIRRSGETAPAAAKRALKHDLMLSRADLKLLSEADFALEDGRSTYMSAYCLVAEPPTAYSTIDIEGLKVISSDQFEEVLAENPERFAPTLRAVWKCCREKLPL